MATKYTGWYCAATASITSQTNTTATITVTSYWQNDGWNYDISYVSSWVYCGSSSYQVMNSGKINSTSSNSARVSCGSYSFVVNKTTSAQNITCYAKITSNSTYVSGTKSSSTINITIPAKPSYTVSYNANGGSGAPSAQTKWYGTNISLSPTKPTRTGYSFQGWGTSSSDTSVDYASGATYSANSGITLYAIWKANTYTVSYNANGGSGAPGNQTKTYGVTLKLSTTKPTRTNYNFLGWGTSANATAVSYASGANYTSNAAITLYAIWELAYVKPRITNIRADRCDADGNLLEEGTYALVTFNWATDRALSSISIQWKTSSESSYSNSTSVTSSGTSGTVNQVIGGGSLDVDHTYDIRVVVTDELDNTHKLTMIPGLAYIIDILNEGKGLGFGKPAELEDVADFEFKIRPSGGILQPILEYGTDLNDVMTPNTYTLRSFNADAGNVYINSPVTGGTGVLEVTSTGENEQLRQRVIACNKTNPVKYERFYYSSSWGEWMQYGGPTVDNLTVNRSLSLADSLVMENSKSLYMKDAGGTSRMVLKNTDSNWLSIGYGNYAAGNGGTDLYGNGISIYSKANISITSTGAGLSGRAYGVNKVLWTGAQYMSAGHTATLSEAISAQPHGAILIWSYYNSPNAENYGFSCHFVPKWYAANCAGCGVSMYMMGGGGYSVPACKYVYIHNTKIIGNDGNYGAGTTHGVQHYESNFVLRWVIGV